MPPISNTFTRFYKGLDKNVWLTMGLLSLLALCLLGFKIATHQSCSDVSIKLTGVVEHHYQNHYFVGETIIFDIAADKAQNVIWDFGDGTALAKGKKQTHSYVHEGTFLVTVKVNGKCAQSLNLTVSQAVMQRSEVATPPADINGIMGKDIATVGELSIYQTEANAGTYTWTVDGRSDMGSKGGQMASFTFMEPGAYNLVLMLDNDPNKTHRKTVIVNAAKQVNTTPADLPPLPMPVAPAPKEDRAQSEEISNNHNSPAEKEIAAKKFEIIPNQILQKQLQAVIDDKETMDNFAKHLCDGANTKVKGNGTIFGNMSLFEKEIKGKKGMLGLGGSRKIKSVSAQRETGSNCIYLLIVEYK